MTMSNILIGTGAYVEITHHYRETNIWADDPANLDTTGFDPSKRYRPFLEHTDNKHLRLLRELLTAGRQLGLHDNKRKRH